MAAIPRYWMAFGLYGGFANASGYVVAGRRIAELGKSAALHPIGRAPGNGPGISSQLLLIAPGGPPLERDR